MAQQSRPGAVHHTVRMGSWVGVPDKKQHVEKPRTKNKRMCKDNHTSRLRTAVATVAVGKGPRVDLFFPKYLEGSVLLNGNYQ